MNLIFWKNKEPISSNLLDTSKVPELLELGYKCVAGHIFQYESLSNTHFPFCLCSECGRGAILCVVKVEYSTLHRHNLLFTTKKKKSLIFIKPFYPWTDDTGINF